MVFMDFVVFGIYPVFILDTKIPPPLPGGLSRICNIYLESRRMNHDSATFELMHLNIASGHPETITDL